MAKGSQGWFVRAPGEIDRIEACFSGTAYAPHRHDFYAIGITLSGVQSFDYRGAARSSLAGQLVIIHPDELHDGRAGDDRAFRYRVAHVAPADVQQVLGGRPLPFVAGGVSQDPRLRAPVRALLDDLARPLSGFEYQDLLYDLANALDRAAGAAARPRIANREAAARARDYIHANWRAPISLGALERATGHDRWQLSRDFRALFGTSPYRYLVMRRLDRAREMMRGGDSDVNAALACGFADQSHFSRLFKRTFGLTPGRWRAAARSFKTEGLTSA